MQNQFEIYLKKYKHFAPLIAGVLFGVWHIVNGNLFQVIITSVIGYLKYFIKDRTLLSVSIGRGLYDFSLLLLRFFML